MNNDMLAELLLLLKPGEPFGTSLCDALMRVTPFIAFEAVALRTNVQAKSKNAIEVFLRRRAPDDTAYPGEWHAPGSLYRHRETDRNVADRLEKEFGTPIVGFTSIGRIIFPDEARGTVHSMLFNVTLGGEPRIDDRHNWFPVSNLPEHTVKSHQKAIIPQVVTFYSNCVHMSG